VGAHVTAGSVKLPAGVALAGDPEQILAVITAEPTAEQLGTAAPAPSEAEEAEEAERVAEGEEGARLAEEPAQASV